MEEGWKGQVYLKDYFKATFTQDCLSGMASPIAPLLRKAKRE